MALYPISICKASVGLFVLASALLMGALHAEEQTLTLRYAHNFSVTYTEAGKLVHVRNPWRGSGEITFTYLLTHDPTSHPKAFPEAERIRIPCERTIAASTTFVRHFVELDLLDKLIGVSDTRLVSSPEARARIDAGTLKAVGQTTTLNLESVLAAAPDLLITSAIGDSREDSHPALLQAGIPVVLSAAYMETHPLASAEWVKFTALFFDKEAEAEALFNGIANAYETLATTVRDIPEHPVVFFNLPWARTWYMPGGGSYRAALVRDAGGTYLFSEDTSQGSLPLDFEAVYAKALDADIWLDTRYCDTRAALAAADNRYTHFKAFRNGHLYNNTAQRTPEGGNPIWERGLLHPEEVLADYIHLFHPKHLPHHHLIYYKALR